MKPIFWTAAGAALIAAGATQAATQTVPFIATEDASLSEVDVGDGDLHGVATFDVRNGDYSRGAYDGDAAGLGRVPVFGALGGVVVLNRRADGQASLFLVGQTSNGFHSPGADERRRPRSWYESNTVLGFAWRPVEGLTAAAAYAVKTSPNGAADTTQEASLSFLYSGEDILGRLSPTFAVTRRTKGDGGFYTTLGIAPQMPLTPSENGPTLTLPVKIGTGWRGFYESGSGNRVFGSAGLRVAQPLRVAGARASLEGEILAIARDAQLRRLDAPDASTKAVIPLATVSITMAW